MKIKKMKQKKEEEIKQKILLKKWTKMIKSSRKLRSSKR